MTDFATKTEYPVIIPCSDAKLEGMLHLPQSVTGVVMFAHGSGSSRFSPRNRHVASLLQASGLATLLFDLLTEEEERADMQSLAFRFDISFLSARLIEVTSWMKDNPALNTLPIGYFGSSTGGAAALMAAAHEKDIVKAVVSRGGRPDLAKDTLSQVKAATLLIVGENDEAVIELNQQALAQLTCIKKLEIVPGATHLFEEAGKLDEVARLASEWFKKYLK